MGGREGDSRGRGGERWSEHSRMHVNVSATFCCLERRAVSMSDRKGGSEITTKKHQKKKRNNHTKASGAEGPKTRGVLHCVVMQGRSAFIPFPPPFFFC